MKRHAVAHKKTAKERRDEIAAAKAVLISSHRLRSVGVLTHFYIHGSFDSWSPLPIHYIVHRTSKK